ncbi:MULTISPECIES: DegT/DnrJ/EryC1/StrS family aminotransferase [Dethiosulfovibrio]|uniref:DegT/DnrJ/EryC1/StrS family aminotransferase n=2 Tax=Dethiosulfovibrio TaxID=47054 RepID=A0ABS9EPW2_9BACT|nr:MULTISPECIES: DegT/DnrJ/EryC1/StrS family aminotransferase [Dethiosulfovibrio]MCF4113138.1 DegT/DnrJ/EryC1/StrS family aminotransferase [Dethiosulfovibrio russensis]MCF4142202.1 DegT/DnrJ/EryC1/StrS family aminotransferase [Dethiosulfovibrio marinus]MCF4146137.1 DegT/DnrJ/EryC1/StrS family aminotransferase [Dethiosulfovibrio acidaminovorans]
MIIPFNKLAPLYEKHKNEYDAAAIEALESGWYILGDKLSSFEGQFADYIGTAHCVGLNSGLDALILALRALGVDAGDEVIVQANTYIATVLGITENGGTPVFVEPDEYHGLNPAKLADAITDKTKAIIAVHLYGQPCDMEPIVEIAGKHGIPLVEDCAQSHGATWKSQKTGTFGTIGCFSFFPTKNLGAFGDAGAIVTDDQEIAEKVRALRNYGSKRKYYNDICGVNSRLDEIQAALLSVRLKYLKETLDERATIADYYLNNIDPSAVTLPSIRSDASHVWHLFVVENDKRDELQQHLSERGIQTQIHYPVPPHLSGAYKNLGFKSGDFPITERLASSVLSLPLYNGMTKDEMDSVCRAVNEFGGMKR